MEEPVKKEEQVPVPVKSQPVYDAVAEQAYTEVERTIQRLSTFLGISEQRVADLFIEAYAHVERLFKSGQVNGPVDGVAHDPDTCTECYNPAP